MQSIINLAAAVFAFLLGSGALLALALWFFKLFGENWLGAKFAERLAAFKHDQQREIEQLRFQISKLLDRTIKLHQREFEVLPKAWSLLAKSYHVVKGVTSPLQSYPDIDRMKSAQLDEFLADCPLQGWQKTELREAKDKNKYYQDAIFWHHVQRARDSCRKSGLFLLKNGIFLPKELKQQFQKIAGLSWEALVEHELNKQHELIPRERKAFDRFDKEGEPLMKELEAAVQERLWSSKIE